METSEYLAFIPLLLFGIGLADLFSEWKRLLTPSQWYLPYSMFTIMLTELGVYNVFIYMNIVHNLNNGSYSDYLFFILPPFLFVILVYSFTPDAEEKTRDYFLNKMPVFCTIFALFSLCHFLYDFNEPAVGTYIRIVAVLAILLAGFLRKVWIIYLLFVLWLVSLFFRGGLLLHF